MNQAERDRLVTLRKAKKRLITQRQAADELGISVRQVKRLLTAVTKHGEEMGVDGLLGQPSKGKMNEKIRCQAMKTFSGETWRDLGPTLAREELERHKIAAIRESVR